mgnify:CR=1 FL=1
MVADYDLSTGANPTLHPRLRVRHDADITRQRVDRPATGNHEHQAPIDFRHALRGQSARV